MGANDLPLSAYRGLRARLDRQDLRSEDWAVLRGFVAKHIARIEARIRRLQAKANNQGAATAPASETSGPSGKAQDSDASAPSPGSAADSSSASAESAENAENAALSGDNRETDGSTDDTMESEGMDAETATDETDPAQGSRKGHGRNGAAAFTNATEYHYKLPPEIFGALCEACGRGTMSRYRDKIIIRIVGQPLFAAERHRYEQARCRLCNVIIRAKGDDIVWAGIGTSYVMYHWSACAMLIVMHYFAGAPFKRLEALHESWGIPLPDANQWHLVDQCDDLLMPLYNALENHGVCNATSLRIDDTGSLIIEIRRAIQKEIEAAIAKGESVRDIRTGINATGAYLETPEGPIVLFFTGRHHAGEIIDRILKHRRTAKNKLVKVTDGASKNFDHSHGDDLIEATCNAHAFLKFHALKDTHPADYAVAGEVYKNVFDNDDKAEARGLDPHERMVFHKQHSLPELERLKQMCMDKLEAKLVEPNSPLWEPMSFIINQWDRLTAFCHIPGIPLDTNRIEQGLVIAVRYLAGSFAYKTQNGADVGDRHMSLIATANAIGVEPVAYLTECLANHEDLARRPEYYLPWVYKERLEAAQRRDASQNANRSSPTQTRTKPRNPHPLSPPPPRPRVHSALRELSAYLTASADLRPLAAPGSVNEPDPRLA